MLLTVAAAQLRGDRPVEQSVQAICQSIETCHAQGVDVVCFPEFAVSGIDLGGIDRQREAIEQGVTRVRKAAAAAHCHVILGTPTFEGDLIYNSAVVIAPDGDIACTYSKVQEEGFFASGRNIALFEVKGVLCTTVICRDLWHPELLRIAAMKGAVVAFVPHASIAGGDALFRLSEDSNHVFRTVAGIRAHENALFLILADLVGSFASGVAHSPGISQIVHPEGIALAKAVAYHEDIITARIDTADRTEDFPAKARDQLFLSDLWAPVLRSVDRFVVPPGAEDET